MQDEGKIKDQLLGGVAILRDEISELNTLEEGPKPAEEGLPKREETALRLAQENAIMAEIGRVISSTLNIKEVYERFAEQVRKLIQFDRIAINIINPETNTFTIPYVLGPNVAEREMGKAVPLAGTGAQGVMQNRSSMLILGENWEEIIVQFPGLLPLYRAGFRSVMLIPLISKDQVIGVLNLQTVKQNAYTEADLRLAERVGTQIAGAIANALLFLERKRAEEALRRSEEEAKRLAKEAAVLAEIGRIISSTLNIEEVYESFAKEAQKLIPFDRISINLISLEEGTVFVAYISGLDIPGRRLGDVFLLKDSVTQKIMSSRMSFLIQPETIEVLESQFSKFVPHFQAGLRSMMALPLISRDTVIGVLHLQSTRIKAYTDQDLRLAELVAAQIAGAIANAQLFAERKGAEEALQKSEEVAKRLAQENAIVAEIGRIISSTLNIEEVYGRFTEEMHKLIPFDRTAFNIINPEDHTAATAYISGMEIAGRRPGDVFPLAGSATEKAARARSGLIIQTEDENEIAAQVPGLLPAFRAGIRSMMMVPLISRDQVIGVLHLQSTKPNAYTEMILRIAERVANQIAGAIANAHLFRERMRAEEEMAALQEQLRQSQKMEAIGRLAGGIAHDFNNLLTIIGTHSQLALMELKEGDPLRESFKAISKATEQSANLVRHLLAFSRRQVMEMIVIDLNTLLRDLEKMLHRIIGEDIELVTVLADDLGRVKTDPGQIEQVVLNLVVNARDAMPQGVKLTIETANVELAGVYARSHMAVTPGSYVMLSMSDTGVGMTSEVRERIFEPFFTTKEKGKGTGLGLSTVYGIVKQSGGNIWVYSEPGQGATFKIYLPRVEEPLTKESEKEELGRFGGGGTILVVAVEEGVRKVVLEVLRRQGYRVLEAAHEEDALLICQQYKGMIHLMTTDVVMPRISGPELAKRLIVFHPEMKVLYMSGYTDNAIVHHGVLEKGVNYIQKPFTVEGLARKVREVLDKDTKPTI
ncbi:MAG: GAF domain-containing protein [Deltaproteobacteria bacterium]|nr:GAF domain-containing protein [Deltaproteobacteria bacterium]